MFHVKHFVKTRCIRAIFFVARFFVSKKSAYYLPTQKGSSSDAPTVKTGVETNELMYVEIGLIGMVVAAIAVRKRNKKRR